MKERLPPLLICLGCLALSLWAACRLMAAAGRPDISLRLAPVRERGKTRLALRFTNHGAREASVEGGEMEFFVYVPDDGTGRNILQAQGAGGKLHLPPGVGVDVGDVYPLVEKLPGGSLSAVYLPAAGASGGVLRSQRLQLEVR